MYLDRAALKAEAKACMRHSKTSPYLTALVYFILTFIISRLSSRLLFPSELIHWVISHEGVYLYISPEYYSYLLSAPLAHIINFLLNVAGLMLSAGMTIFCLHAARREENSIWNLVDGFAIFWRLFLLNLVEGLLIFLWSLLFIIPGFVAAYRYRLAIYLLIDHPRWGVMDCIRESKRLMSGRKGELFVLDLSFIGWNILTMIPFVSIYVAPYTGTTYAGYYLAVTAMDARRYEPPAS